MLGQRNSLLFTIATNPLIWIGVFLGLIHISKSANSDVWQIFQNPETYGNLLLGSTLWTLLFDCHYTENRKKVAIVENIFAILVNAYIILFVWGTVVFAISEYRASGIQFSIALRKKLAEQRTAAPHGNTYETPASLPSSVNLESGKRYKLTPNADGSFILEVMDD